MATKQFHELATEMLLQTTVAFLILGSQGVFKSKI